MKAGAVHGRFQPFHNGHLRYVLEARRKIDFLWVGITMCNLASLDKTFATGSREDPENNPLTFFERLNIVADALVENGVDRSEFGFVPFPIETPERLPEFMSTDVPCYTTVCEPWNERKIERLRKVGYEVTVLYREHPKKISGSAIREDIVKGGNLWKGLVPEATVRAVEGLNLRDRLISLRLK